MNIVFLDVDGVLNYDGCQENFNGFCGVVDDRVELLARIVKGANAQIVLVSSWKGLWNEPGPNTQMNPLAKYLVEKLAKQGLHIADRTDDKGSDRGKGINRWIRRVPKQVTSWIVLDDEVFPDYEDEGIMPHLVKTESSTGLQEEHVEQALKLLNGK